MYGVAGRARPASRRGTLLLSTPPYPATKPLDSPLVCPEQEWLDLLEGFVGRI
jgi:hypothetical protein